MGAQCLNDLVFVHYNLRLKWKKIMSPNDMESDSQHDPIDFGYTFPLEIDDADLDEVDPLSLWMDDIGGDPTLYVLEGDHILLLMAHLGFDLDLFVKKVMEVLSFSVMLTSPQDNRVELLRQQDLTL